MIHSYSYFEIGGEIYESCTPIQRSIIDDVLQEDRQEIETKQIVEKKISKKAMENNTSALPYTPYSYGSPLVWAGSQVFMRVASRFLPGPGMAYNPRTGRKEPTAY